MSKKLLDDLMQLGVARTSELNQLYIPVSEQVNFAKVNDLQQYALKKEVVTSKDLSSYALKKELGSYQPKGDYALKKDLPVVPANFATKADLAAYQPKGAYHSQGSDLAMSDKTIFFRAAGDANHTLAYASAVDGPRLSGCKGGQIGTQCGGAKTAIQWDNAGNVVIAGDLAVKGRNVLGELDAIKAKVGLK